MKVILASQSPRRRELLESMGIKDYEVIVSKVEETMDNTLPVKEQVKQLSYRKSESVWNQTQGDRIVIGSDTIVEKDNKIYGKPKDKEDAIKMLKEFSNSKVNIITGIAVIIESNGIITKHIDCDLSEVYIKSITDKEIEKWLNTGNAWDKAGAFGVQCEFCVHIDKIVGNYDAILGLPTSKLYDFMKDYIN